MQYNYSIHITRKMELKKISRCNDLTGVFHRSGEICERKKQLS